MDKMRDIFSKIKHGIKVLFVPDQIHINNEKVVTPPKPVTPYVVIILAIVLFFAVRATEFSFIVLLDRLTGWSYRHNQYVPLNVYTLLKTYYFPIYWPSWKQFIDPVLETVQIAFLGSFLGSLLALPVSFFASSNITKNRFVLVFTRTILSVFRTIPTIVYAGLFVFVFGKDPFAGTLAVMLFTFSIVTKMLFERIETVDLGPYEAIQSTGATKSKSFITAIIPQILPSYISMSLYSFEINVRYAAILGLVGAGGIGLILKGNMEDLDVDTYFSNTVFVILFYIWIVVIVIETLSRYIRRRLA